MAREAHLDGVRGVASCVVFFGHLSLALVGNGWIFNGNGAVCIFFVLSGYVLSELAQRSGLSFPAQVVRRYMRLVIPMLVTSLFAWALLALHLYKNQEAAALTGSWWLASWYKFDSSFKAMVVETVYGVFVNGHSDYNCNLWTMRPELIGSLFVFLVNAAGRTPRIRAMCYILLSVGYWGDYVLLFPVGALLHEYRNDLGQAQNGTAWKAAVFLTGLLLVSAPQIWLHRLGLPAIDGLYWHMLGATMLVAAILNWPLLQAVLGGAVGRLLGRISFVLYLIHVPIICSLTSWLVLNVPPNLATPAAASATIVVVFAVSIAMYRWIDLLPTRWSRSAGRAVDGWLGSRPLVKPDKTVQSP
ncbi:acyltransferase [Pseudolabrys sp. Root1462]|uniref:acyltransferase family protein n=1 Tax=Pseudolabrys sp. Root1462 TaxID=1736466 RepID=UPI0009E9A904|nr:acyltransferase [Pseudolabrys sp. Root1462]